MLQSGIRYRFEKSLKYLGFSKKNVDPIAGRLHIHKNNSIKNEGRTSSQSLPVMNSPTYEEKSEVTKDKKEIKEKLASF